MNSLRLFFKVDGNDGNRIKLARLEAEDTAGGKKLSWEGLWYAELEGYHLDEVQIVKWTNGVRSLCLLTVLQMIHRLEGNDGALKFTVDEHKLAEALCSLVRNARTKKAAKWFCNLFGDTLSPVEQAFASDKVTKDIRFKEKWLRDASLQVFLNPSLGKRGKFEGLLEKEKVQSLKMIAANIEGSIGTGTEPPINSEVLTAEDFWDPFRDHGSRGVRLRNSVVLTDAYDHPIHQPDVDALVAVARFFSYEAFRNTDFFAVHPDSDDYHHLEMHKKKAALCIGRHANAFDRDRIHLEGLPDPKIKFADLPIKKRGGRFTPALIRDHYWLEVGGRRFTVEHKLGTGTNGKRTDYGVIRLFKRGHLWIAELAGLTGLGTLGAAIFSTELDFQNLRLSRSFRENLSLDKPDPFELLIKVESPIRYVDRRRAGERRKIRVYQPWRCSVQKIIVAYLGNECVYSCD